jgi:hypothetical protein
MNEKPVRCAYGTWRLTAHDSYAFSSDPLACQSLYKYTLR